MNEPYLYYLFRDGLFVGKYLFSEWQKLKPDEIFNSHVYSNRNKGWNWVVERPSDQFTIQNPTLEPLAHQLRLMALIGG